MSTVAEDFVGGVLEVLRNVFGESLRNVHEHLKQKGVDVDYDELLEAAGLPDAEGVDLPVAMKNHVSGKGQKTTAGTSKKPAAAKKAVPPEKQCRWMIKATTKAPARQCPKPKAKDEIHFCATHKNSTAAEEQRARIIAEDKKKGKRGDDSDEEEEEEEEDDDDAPPAKPVSKVGAKAKAVAKPTLKVVAKKAPAKKPAVADDEEGSGGEEASTAHSRSGTNLNFVPTKDPKVFINKSTGFLVNKEGGKAQVFAKEVNGKQLELTTGDISALKTLGLAVRKDVMEKHNKKAAKPSAKPDADEELPEKNEGSEEESEQPLAGSEGEDDKEQRGNTKPVAKPKAGAAASKPVAKPKPVAVKAKPAIVKDDEEEDATPKPAAKPVAKPKPVASKTKAPAKPASEPKSEEEDATPKPPAKPTANGKPKVVATVESEPKSEEETKPEETKPESEESVVEESKSDAAAVSADEDTKKPSNSKTVANGKPKSSDEDEENQDAAEPAEAKPPAKKLVKKPVV